MPSLMVFVDALPFAEIGELPGLSSWPWRARLKPGFGYSINLHAEIFAGLSPDQVGYFGEWAYDPTSAPVQHYRTLLPVLERLCRPYVVNRGVQSILTRRYRPDRLMPNLPLARLGDFAIRGEKVASPAFTHPTIFSNHPRLTRVSAEGLAKGRRDEALASRASCAIEGGASLVYAPLLDLDGVGHRHGTDSTEWRDHLSRIDKWVTDLTQEFLGRHPDGDVFVVSDHGMASVREAVRFDVEARLGVSAGKRYLYFTDSTLVRLWAFDQSLAPQLDAFFAGHVAAAVVTEEERREYGLTNRAFGDYIAVLREGACYRPSTFARNVPAAMHGYHPDVASQHAVLLHRGANRPGRSATRTIDAFGILDEALARG